MVGLAARKGYHLHLVNFGCSGATTSSVLHSPGCASNYPAPGAPPYRVPQAAAALAYLRAHAGRVALVTVSLGGNDVTPCSADAQAVGCLTRALRRATRNIGRRVRPSAPRPRTPSSSAPATRTSSWARRSRPTQPSSNWRGSRCSASARSSIPPCASVIIRSGGSFVDVTAATGGYLPLSRTTTLAPYGRIPVAVANVCRLTYYCEYGDIHPPHHRLCRIARLVAARLPRR